MTQDEIIRMAREAGAEFAELPMMDAIVFSVDDREWNSEELMIFAALVAAHECEACAKVCEGFVQVYGYEDIAAAIRARGE